MENDRNATYDDGAEEIHYLCEFFDLSAIEGASFIIIFIFSILGNSLLICILVCYEKLKKATNLFVLNLACSDLVFAVTLPFWAVYHLDQWIFGDFLCKFVTAAHFVGLYSSVIILTAMTVDRFITVVLNSWSNNDLRRQKYAIGACLAAWIISVAASVSDGMKMETNNEHDVYYCEDSGVQLGDYFQLPLLFFLPFAIVIFCYCSIIKTVLRASNRKRYRTVAVVLSIVAAFFICWGPYNILLFIGLFYESNMCNEEQKLKLAYQFCRILAFSHCCMNPLFYMLSQKLRKHILHLLRHKTVCTNKEATTVLTATQNVAFMAHNSSVMDLDNK